MKRFLLFISLLLGVSAMGQTIPFSALNTNQFAISKTVPYATIKNGALATNMFMPSLTITNDGTGGGGQLNFHVGAEQWDYKVQAGSFLLFSPYGSPINFNTNGMTFIRGNAGSAQATNIIFLVKSSGTSTNFILSVNTSNQVVIQSIDTQGTNALLQLWGTNSTPSSFGPGAGLSIGTLTAAGPGSILATNSITGLNFRASSGGSASAVAFGTAANTGIYDAGGNTFGISAASTAIAGGDSSGFGVVTKLGFGTAITSFDTWLQRDAANTLALRNGTSAQAFNVYETYTDSSNYRRLNVRTTGAGSLGLYLQSAGTGAGGASLRLESDGGGSIAFSPGGSTTAWTMNSSGNFADQGLHSINAGTAASGLSGGDISASRGVTSGVLYLGSDGQAYIYRDSSQNIQLVGNVYMPVNRTFSIASGTNKRAGTATLVGGTVTVANTTVTANTLVLANRKAAGGTIGDLTWTVSAATSFTINSASGTDTSTVDYFLIENP